MLQDLEQGVDRSEAKLNSAMSRMRKFIRQTEGSFTLLCQLCPPLLIYETSETKSGWCIVFLIIVLMALQIGRAHV